jgi:hypothetical protein
MKIQTGDALILMALNTIIVFTLDSKLSRYHLRKAWLLISICIHREKRVVI